MKLSVIIPIYNCEEYLSACLESVCNQTYQNLQIILIDDGSTDGSGAVCDQYAQMDDRIFVIHQENAGVSTARNKGLQFASGDLVSFVDGDDYLDLDMYEFLIDLMNTCRADIVHCGYRRIVDGQITLQQNTGKQYIQNRDEATFCMMAGKVFHCGLWNKLYRRELLRDLFFEEKLRINEDILFNFYAFQQAIRLVYIDVPKYNYVAHPGSACTATQDWNKAADGCFVNQEMLTALRSTALESVARSRYMRSLSICYRECGNANLPNCRTLRKNIAHQLWAEAETRNVSESRMLITAFLIRYLPWLYRLIYGIYSRIRKPKWEPGQL